MLKKVSREICKRPAIALPLIKQLFLAVVLISIATGFIDAVCAQKRQGRQVSANNFPGSDLGAKINAADAALGTQPGEIVVKGGGTISTQVIVSSDHVLHFLAGTYTTKTSATPILMKSRSSIIGSGWDAIIMESTAKDQFTVISAYGHDLTVNHQAGSGVVIKSRDAKNAYHAERSRLEQGVDKRRDCRTLSQHEQSADQH